MMITQSASVDSYHCPGWYNVRHHVAAYSELLSFRYDAPRCIHRSESFTPLTDRQLSVWFYDLLLFLFLAFLNSVPYST